MKFFGGWTWFLFITRTMCSTAILILTCLRMICELLNCETHPSSIGLRMVNSWPIRFAPCCRLACLDIDRVSNISMVVHFDPAMKCWFPSSISLSTVTLVNGYPSTLGILHLLIWNGCILSPFASVGYIADVHAAYVTHHISVLFNDYVHVYGHVC